MRAFILLAYIVVQLIVLFGSVELFDLEWYWIAMPSILFVLHFPVLIVYDYIRLWVRSKIEYNIKFNGKEKLY